MGMMYSALLKSLCSNANTSDHEEVETKLASLQNAIARALVNCPPSRGWPSFLPDSDFKTLIDDFNVECVLTELDIKSPEKRAGIMKDCRKVFAILVFIDMASAIVKVWKSGFKDEHLPLRQLNPTESKERYTLALKHDNSPKNKLLQGFQSSKWTYKKESDFVRDQWMFLAPIFVANRDDLIEYPLDESEPPPLVYKDDTPIGSGGFGSVYKARIHRAHQTSLEPEHGDEEGVEIALKVMTNDKDYQVERDILDALRNIDHEHLIKVIAAFTWRGKKYLMFKLANGGNLRELWSSRDPDNSKKLTADAVIWALGQMKGLVEAVSKLHTFDSHRNIRHGDLKPENIVRFTGSNTRENERGLLQVADMGLGKVRDHATALIPTKTGDQLGTERYFSPELSQKKKAISRADDMWAIGCTFLEFIIWVLYGRDGYLTFFRCFSTSESFFVITPAGVKRRDEVQQWIDYVYKHDLRRDDNACTSIALRSVLDFICEKLLIADREPEKTNADTETPNPPAATEQPRVTVDEPQTEDAEPRLIRRATSDEFFETLKTICEKGAAEPDYILSRDPQRDPSGPSVSAAHVPETNTVGGLLSAVNNSFIRRRSANSIPQANTQNVSFQR